MTYPRGLLEALSGNLEGVVRGGHATCTRVFVAAPLDILQGGEGTLAAALFTEVPRRVILGTSPRSRGLEGKHPVGFRSELCYVRGGRPPAVDRGQALLVLSRPTGDRAPLSDVNGNLVLHQLVK